MNKPFTLLLTSLALACMSPALDAATRAVETVGQGALSACPQNLDADTIYHFDKVVFTISGALTADKPEDQVALNNLPRNIPLDVKLRDHPGRIANLKAKVLSFMGAATVAENANNITIQEVAYTAVVCPRGTPNPT